MPAIQRLRLRYICTASFVQSEKTNFDELLKKHSYLKKLGPQDAVLIRSKRGDQIVIAFGYNAINTKEGKSTYFDSRKIRLVDSEWNALKIADYGRLVGIHFVGLPTFEQHLRRILGAKLYQESKRISQ